MDSQGMQCLGNSWKNQTLRDWSDDGLIKLNTMIHYNKSGKTANLHGMNNTIFLADVIKVAQNSFQHLDFDGSL